VKPYTAQRVTANMLVLNPMCYVLNEMRTGKTLSSLWAADFLMRQYPGARTLILSNLSTVRDVWQTAITTHFLGRRTCIVVHAHDNKARFKRLASPADFYIMNHDALRNGVSFEKRHMRIRGLAAELIRRKDICIIIIDEASAFKASQTARSKAGREIIARNKPVRWPMTGSPTPQKPTDIHGLRRLADPNYIDRYDHVRNLLMEPRGEWKWEAKPGAYEVAAQLLTPAVRFRAVDCFDAPPQTITKRRALLSDEQKLHMKKLKDEALTLLQKAGGVVAKVSAANAGVLRSKSLQICSGAIYDDQGLAHKLNCSDRLNVLDEIAEQAPGEKIIVLAPFTSVLHMLYSHLGDGPSVFVDGSIPAKDRTDLLFSFTTDPRKRWLVAQPEVLKFGLDLSAASIIVWFGPVDKTETWIQANKRICGPNQTKPTLVVCLSAHSLEDVVYNRLQNQEDMQDVFLTLIEESRARRE
jgi:SNF2 family DNA or RNA helicase